MPTSRRLFAEALGTALLLAIVIGSGVMGERLAGGNVAMALIVNTLSTVGGLSGKGLRSWGRIRGPQRVRAGQSR